MDIALLNLSINEPAIKGLESTGGLFCVTGYDTSLQLYLVALMLEKHFASCGAVRYVDVPRDLEKSILERSSFVRIAGEGAREKALELSGSDVGGWNVVVKEAAPFENIDKNPSPYQEPCQDNTITVKGYDTSVPKIDIQIALCKHFSSCGEIESIVVLSSIGSALVRICGGEDAIDKAMKLNGCDVGGWKIVIDNKVMRPHRLNRGGIPRSCGYTPPALKAKIAAERRKLQEAEKRKLEQEQEQKKKKKKKK